MKRIITHMENILMDEVRRDELVKTLEDLERLVVHLGTDLETEQQIGAATRRAKVRLNLHRQLVEAFSTALMGAVQAVAAAGVLESQLTASERQIVVRSSASGTKAKVVH